MKYYIKDKDLTWPTEPVFYILAQEGLYKCRNHMFFRSCVLVSGERSDLEGLLPQKEVCSLRYPQIPAWFMRDTLAFFHETARKHQAEAIVLLGYDILNQVWVPIVPDQTSGGMEVKYQVPDDIDENIVILGDIHSHVDAAAFHSGTDIFDEKLRDGLHVTLGHVRSPVPDISVEMVQDGQRFKVDPDHIIEEWSGRSNKIPDGWMDKFTYKSWSQHEWRGYTGGGKRHKARWKEWIGLGGYGCE